MSILPSPPGQISPPPCRRVAVRDGIAHPGGHRIPEGLADAEDAREQVPVGDAVARGAEMGLEVAPARFGPARSGICSATRRPDAGSRTMRRGRRGSRGRRVSRGTARARPARLRRDSAGPPGPPRRVPNPRHRKARSDSGPAGANPRRARRSDRGARSRSRCLRGRGRRRSDRPGSTRKSWSGRLAIWPRVLGVSRTIATASAPGRDPWPGQLLDPSLQRASWSSRRLNAPVGGGGTCELPRRARRGKTAISPRVTELFGQ